ncbi:MAG TPA: hypothetical protein VGD60_15050, partial [Candidatus Acidoferrales bacterium]
LQGSEDLVPEMMTMGQHLAVEKIPGIFQDLCRQFPELQGEAKFCGPADPTKKSLLLGARPFPAGN